MLKNDFVKKISEKAGCTKADAEVFMKALHDVVVEALANEDDVKPFKGLTLSGEMTKEMTRRNPQTGEPVVVAPHIKAKAKFSQSFKDELNK